MFCGNLVDVIDAVWTVMAAGCLTCSFCLHHRQAAVFSCCSHRSALTWSTCVEELCYLCWWWCLFFTSWLSLSPPSSFYSVAVWTSLPPSACSVFMVPGTIRKAQNLLKQYSQHGLDGKKGGSNLTPLEGNTPPLLFSFHSLTVQTCCHSSTCHNSFHMLKTQILWNESWEINMVNSSCGNYFYYLGETFHPETYKNYLNPQCSDKFGL